MPKPVAYISLPKGLPTKLVRSTRELKAVCVLYQLKSLYVGGYICQFGKQAKAIATRFGYSERKLRTYVALLQQLGYLSKPNRHDLRLRGSKRLGEDYGVATTYYRIPTAELANLELLVRAFAVQENLDRQTYTIEQKLKAHYLRDRGIFTSTHQPAAVRRALRGFSVADARCTLTSRFVAAAENFEALPELNPFATLSRHGLARALSRKSKATGHRYALKMRQAGLLAEKPHRVFICDSSYQEFMRMRAALELDYSYQWAATGKVEKVLAHTLTLSLPKA